MDKNIKAVKRVPTSCGFPQSHPVPHEHDRTEREKQIIKYKDEIISDLYEALKQLLMASKGDGKRQHHNHCYGIDIEPHPDCELCKLIPIERLARDALAKADGGKL